MLLVNHNPPISGTRLWAIPQSSFNRWIFGAIPQRCTYYNLSYNSKPMRERAKVFLFCGRFIVWLLNWCVHLHLSIAVFSAAPLPWIIELKWNPTHLPCQGSPARPKPMRKHRCSWLPHAHSVNIIDSKLQLQFWCRSNSWNNFPFLSMRLETPSLWKHPVIFHRKNTWKLGPLATLGANGSFRPQSRHVDVQIGFKEDFETGQQKLDMNHLLDLIISFISSFSGV